MPLWIKIEAEGLIWNVNIIKNELIWNKVDFWAKNVAKDIGGHFIMKEAWHVYCQWQSFNNYEAKTNRNSRIENLL